MQASLPLHYRLRRLLLTTLLLGFASCDHRESAGSDYVLVTPESLPDGHPGTTLSRKGKIIWRNVYPGYFNGHEAKQFCHEGMFVFVGAVPGKTDWWHYSQLFAVRGSGPPVLLSERLLGETFVISYDSRTPGSGYAVDSLAPAEDGVRVQFTHSAGTVNHDTNSIMLSWERLRQLLDEADSSGRLVHHPLGDYRILPKE